MVAYTIFVVALLHALDVLRTVHNRSARIRAVVLFAAVTLQVALGIVTLVLRVPLPLALAHQAMVMLILTVATLHAATLAERAPQAIAAPARGWG
jgi:heme a synthase